MPKLQTEFKPGDAVVIRTENTYHVSVSFEPHTVRKVYRSGRLILDHNAKQWKVYQDGEVHMVDYSAWVTLVHDTPELRKEMENCRLRDDLRYRLFNARSKFEKLNIKWLTMEDQDDAELIIAGINTLSPRINDRK